jgi:hypothetical protein
MIYSALWKRRLSQDIGVDVRIAKQQKKIFIGAGEGISAPLY